MACRYTYKGKEYSAAEFMRVLADMAPETAAKYMPGVNSLPNAPFVSRTEDWAGLAMKRAIRYAVEHGFDRVTWDTGETNAERYDLSKQVDGVRVMSHGRDANLVHVMVKRKGSREYERYADTSAVEKAKLPDVIGKELSNKALDVLNAGEPIAEFEGLDLKVGGEGMVGFYDRILPATVGKLIKRWGGRIIRSGVDGEKFSVVPVHGFDITEAMREEALNGLPMFQRTPNDIPDGQPWAVVQGKQFGVGKFKTDQDSFLYEWQDKHIDTKRVVQAIEAINNQQVEDAKDPYLAEELYHQRTAYRVKNFLNDELKPLLEHAKRLGVSVEDLEQYLWARHAEERNRTIAQRNPQMPDGGSGMMTDDARAYLAGLQPAQLAKLQTLAARVDTMIGKTRQTLVGYGLESQTTMAMRQAAWPTYVPLHRADYENDAAYGIGQGFSVKGPDSKAALGSSQKVVNILAEIAKQREQAIVRGEKNRVSMALFGLAQANPNPQWWSTTRLPKKRWLDKSTNTVRSMVDPNWKNKPNVVVMRFPNKTGRIVERAVIFNENNPRAMRMAESLKNLDAIQLEGAMGVAASVSRYISSVNTQYNPLFGMFNLWRDVQEGMLNLTTTPIKGQQAKVAKYAGIIVRESIIGKGVWEDLRKARKGQHPQSQWARWFEEMEAEGGTTGYRDLFSTSAERAQSILDEFKQIDENAAKKSIRAIGHWLTDYNTLMESSIRIAAYRTARESGLSKARAASVAKNITINFNRKGRKGQQANALYSFFNARVQGVARSMETWAGPAGKAIIAGGLLLGAMQAIVLTMAGYDDEDPPEFVKQQNFIIPITGGKYLMWNMPQSMRFLISMGRLPTEAMLRESKSAGDAFMNMFATVLDAFNPTGTSTVAQTAAPTILDPAVALLENKEWTGSSIYQEKIDPMDPTPGFARSKNTSSSIGKVAARGINYLSGGTEYTASQLGQDNALFSPTPDQIDYLLAQATGGIGREFSKGEQTVTALATGQDLPSYKIPLLGKLYGTTTGRSSERDKFYELAREGRRHMAELEGRGSEARIDRFSAQERVDEYLKDHPEYRGAINAVKAARTVSDIRGEKRKAAAQGATQAELNAYDDQVANIITNTMQRNKELRQEAR